MPQSAPPDDLLADLEAEAIAYAQDERKRYPNFSLDAMPGRFREVLPAVREFLDGQDHLGSVLGRPRFQPPSLDRYTNYRLLEEGGRGVICLVYDKVLERDVVMKLVRPHLETDESVKSRFQREAKITARLEEHPGIAPVHDLGETGDHRRYLTMKFVNGRTLAGLLRQGPLDHTRLVSIFESICQVVSFAHSRKILHRDLKPSNVMVGYFGEVYVIDWGMAKEVASIEDEQAAGPADQTRNERLDRDETIGFIGTWAYASWEQANWKEPNDSKNVGPEADVFSLGAILCVLLTGDPPYTGTTPAEVERKAKAADLADARLRLEQVAPEFKRLAALARWCLKDRAERPEHAGAVVSWLARYKRILLEEAKRTTIVEAKAEERVAQERIRADERVAHERRLADEGIARERERRRSQRKLFVRTIALLLVVFAGICFSFWLRRRADDAVTAGVDKADQLSRVADDLRDQNPDAALSALHEAESILAQAEQASGLWLVGRKSRALLADKQRAVASGRQRLARQYQLVRDMRAAGSLIGARLLAFEVDWHAPVIAYRETFREFGTDLEQTPAERIDEELAALPPRFREEVLSGLHLWLLLSREDRTHILPLLEKHDSRSWRQKFRVAAAAANVPAVKALASDMTKILTAGKKSQAPPALDVRLLGEALLECGEYQAAIALLTQATFVHDSEASLHQLLGRAYQARVPAQTGRCIECFRAAVTRDPENPVLRTQLALALQEDGRDAEASICFREALKLAPANPQVRVVQTGCRFLRGDSEPFKDLRALLLEHPGNGDLRALLAFKIAPHPGALPEARKLLAEAKKLRSTRTNVALAEAQITFAEERYEEFLEQIQALRREWPGDPLLAQFEALGFITTARIDEGERFARSCLEIDAIARPLARNCHDFLALAAILRGQPKVAEQHARAADRINASLLAATNVPVFRAGLMHSLIQQGRFDEASECLRKGKHDRNRHLVVPMIKMLAGLSRLKEITRDPTRKLPQLTNLEALKLVFQGNIEKLVESIPILVPDIQLADGRPVAAYQNFRALFNLSSMFSRVESPIWINEIFRLKLRISAARAAVRTACDMPYMGVNLPAAESVNARKAALGWLREELRDLQREAARAKGQIKVRGMVYYLQHCPDLAGVRERDRRALLPAAERGEWETLWQDIERLALKVKPPVRPKRG